MPILLDYSGLFPQVECSIQNMRGLCALDLGAENTFISAKAAKGLKITGEQSMQTLGGVETYPTVEIKSLNLGSEQLSTNLKVLVQTEIPTTSGQELIATIGADAIKDKVTIIDNARILSASAAIYINPTTAQTSVFKTKGKMLPGSKRPIIEIKIGNQTARALIDTHAQSAVTGAFVKNNPELFQLLGRQQKTDIAGFTKSYMMAQPTEQICIQNQCTKNLWPYMVIPPQENIDIILGIDYVQQYTWLFDKKSQQYAAIKKQNMKR
ncbi:aspartyl protease family protein [Bdellovibrio sp. HCB185ZH]|uniref:aspartyl protease family protein n=1 Tax=Bdellovibrio sp. HCB185ZH TaxID=3394235 RepID=UPI0039A495E1